MNDEIIIYLNGDYVPESRATVSVFDQGVLFGDGVFEGLRVYNGQVFKLAEHIHRFCQGAKVLMLELPDSPREIMDIVLETCRRNKTRDGYVRLVATRGIGDLGLLPVPPARPTVFCIAARLSLYPASVYEQGMPIITAVQRRNRAGILDPRIKSLNYLNNILAKIEGARAGVPEALMLTEEGLVAECTGDNIFIVLDGRIITPPVHLGILDGITRRTVIDLARQQGLDVSESPFTLYDVYNSEECFLTGTAAELAPVRSVDGRTIGKGQPGPLTRRLGRLFQEYARSNGAPVFREA